MSLSATYAPIPPKVPITVDSTNTVSIRKVLTPLQFLHTYLDVRLTFKK